MDLMRKALAAHDGCCARRSRGTGLVVQARTLVAVRRIAKQRIHGPNQLPKGIAVKQPELTQLIGLQDGDGDRVFISRLDRPDGSRGYLSPLGREKCTAVCLSPPAIWTS